MIEPRLWDTRQAAEFLHLNRFTLYRMAGRRKIPHLRIGRKLLFDKSRIEKWIEGRAVPERHGGRP
jgi:excisionase family DNA binding protein